MVRTRALPVCRLVKPVARFAIQSVNQELAGINCGEDLTVAGLALAAVAVFSSITPLATMASSTAAARACAASMWRSGSNSEGAWIKPANIAASANVRSAGRLPK